MSGIQKDRTAFGGFLGRAEEGVALVAYIGDTPEQADDQPAPAVLASELLDVARRGGQRLCRSTFVLAFLDGHGAYRETLTQQELADVPVVCGVVVLTLIRRDFAVFVVIGAERQDDADFTVGVGQSLVSGRGIGGVGAFCDDRGICGEVVDAFDEFAALAQRIPKVSHVISAAPAEAIVARALPDAVRIERQANLHDILDPVAENERAGVSVAHIELAVLVVAILSENVDLPVVLGRGLPGCGLQRAGKIQELPADVRGHDQEVGCIVGDLDDAGEGDVAFVRILRVIGEGRGAGEEKKAASEGRGQRAIEHGPEFLRVVANGASASAWCADYPWPHGRRLAVYFPLNLEHFPTAKASVRTWCQVDRSSTFSTSRGAIMAAFADMMVDRLPWRGSCQSRRLQRSMSATWCTTSRLPSRGTPSISASRFSQALHRRSPT